MDRNTNEEITGAQLCQGMGSYFIAGPQRTCGDVLKLV